MTKCHVKNKKYYWVKSIYLNLKIKITENYSDNISFFNIDCLSLITVDLVLIKFFCSIQLCDNDLSLNRTNFLVSMLSLYDQNLCMGGCKRLIREERT